MHFKKDIYESYMDPETMHGSVVIRGVHENPSHVGKETLFDVINLWRWCLSLRRSVEGKDKPVCHIHSLGQHNSWEYSTITSNQLDLVFTA
jgi:hypothetical protein